MTFLKAKNMLFWDFMLIVVLNPTKIDLKAV